MGIEPAAGFLRSGVAIVPLAPWRQVSQTLDAFDETPLQRMAEHLRRGDPDAADAIARELLVTSAPNSEGHVGALVQLARSAIDAGQLSTALELGLEAHARSDGLSGDRQIGALYTLTVIYTEIGDVATAFDYSMQVIDRALAHGDPEQIFHAYNNLGYAYLSEGLPLRAEEYFEFARPYADGRARETAFLVRNLSQVYIDTGRFDLAVEYATQAMALANDCGDVIIGRYAAYSQAQITALRGDRRRAIEEYEALLRSAQRLDLRVLCRFNLAEQHRMNGHLDAAITCLEHLCDDELGATERTRDLARCHELRAQIHKEAGRFEAALQALEVAYRLQEASRKQQAENRALALDVERRMEALQRESEALRRRNNELARANEAAIELSSRDDLTGLYNRRHLFDQGKIATTSALESGRSLSVAMIDLDQFKEVNDTLGHGIGDAVLGLIAQVLASTLRGDDLIARYGGEEFVAVMPGTSLDAAVRACERIRRAVAATDWAEIDPSLGVTVSIGVAALGDVETWAALLAEADAQLYRAKGAGRNCVAAADRSMS